MVHIKIKNRNKTAKKLVHMALSVLFSARKDRKIRFYGKFLMALKFKRGRWPRQTKIVLLLHNDDLLPERNYTIPHGWEKHAVEDAKDEK